MYIIFVYVMLNFIAKSFHVRTNVQCLFEFEVIMLLDSSFFINDFKCKSYEALPEK